VCLGNDVRPELETGGYTLSRCNGCGHTWVSGGLTPTTLAAAYGQDYYTANGDECTKGYQDYLRDSDARSRGFKERLNLLEQFAPRRGYLLDYGCAVGLFAKVAADAGWNAMGYERSEWAADYARQKLGLNIVTGDGSEALPFDGTLDAVTLWDVIEHLDNPRGVISALSRSLKPGGLLALNTINGSSAGARMAGRDWRHIAPPHHLQYFTRSSLTRLLDQFGFRIVSTHARGVMFDARRSPRSLRGSVAWLERLVTHWRVASIADRLNLLDEIEIIAVKT
jgi:SAM-dependent methyltransferase